MSLISDFSAYLRRVFASFTTTTTNNPVSAPAALTSEPPIPRSHFRLDNDSSDTLTLPDGRKLGYAQYGSLTGQAILYQHGLPGSRIEAAFYHDLGVELGARIIAVDRPGVGWSSPNPGRTLLDHPKDLEQLVKHLSLDDYSVLGVSGGGPYALACAIALPRENLKCISIVCGLGPPDIGMRGVSWMRWLGFTVGLRYAPSFVMRWFWQRQPAARQDLTEERRLELMLQQTRSTAKTISQKKDLEAIGDEGVLRLILRSAGESFAQGFDGVLQDGSLMCMDWGFRIEDIRADLPVQLWYGRLDTNVPLNHGEQIAARLGGRAYLRVEDETHASIGISRRDDVLKALVGST